MKKKIEKLVMELVEENERRSQIAESDDCTKEMRSILVYEYNSTVRIIGKLNNILETE